MPRKRKVVRLGVGDIEDIDSRLEKIESDKITSDLRTLLERFGALLGNEIVTEVFAATENNAKEATAQLQRLLAPEEEERPKEKKRPRKPAASSLDVPAQHVAPGRAPESGNPDPDKFRENADFVASMFPDVARDLIEDVLFEANNDVLRSLDHLLPVDILQSPRILGVCCPLSLSLLWLRLADRSAHVDRGNHGDRSTTKRESIFSTASAQRTTIKTIGLKNRKKETMLMLMLMLMLIVE